MQKNIFLPLISLFSLVTFSACSNSSLPPEQQLVSDAMSKNIAGNYQDALTDLNKAIQLQPDDGNAYLIRGMTTIEIGTDKAQGMADLDKSIQLNPKLPDGYFQKGLYQIEDQLGTIEEACNNFSTAADLGMPQAKQQYDQNCNSPVESKPTITANTPFTLGVGQSAIFTPNNLTVQFTAVSSDSRCPSDVECVWAGQATVHVKVTGPSSPTVEADLITPGTTKNSVQLGGDGGIGYSLELSDLKPYPLSKHPITSDSYQATFQLVVAK